MQLLEWRVRLAVLWFAQAVNYTAYIWIGFAETGSLGTVGSGETGMLLAVFYFIPCALAWLSFVVQPAVSRWPHIGFGVLFGGIKLYATLTSVAGAGSAAVALNELWAFVAAALIVWCAWRLPSTA